jgi:hypothetical protein
MNTDELGSLPGLKCSVHQFSQRLLVYRDRKWTKKAVAQAEQSVFICG